VLRKNQTVDSFEKNRKGLKNFSFRPFSPHQRDSRSSDDALKKWGHRAMLAPSYLGTIFAAGGLNF
jgi:hypothetical protein